MAVVERFTFAQGETEGFTPFSTRIELRAIFQSPNVMDKYSITFWWMLVSRSLKWYSYQHYKTYIATQRYSIVRGDAYVPM